MIYCNGDSFTAGTELADYEYFKDSYPGIFNKEYSENYAYADWWNTTVVNHFTRLSPADQQTKLNKEKSKAWPAKLEKILNVPIINSGYMGSSIEFLVRTTITDILLSTDPISVVIIQLPPIERIEVSHNNKFYSISMSNTKHWISNIQTILKSLTVSETTYTLQRRYLFSLIQLADFCRNNNIKLIAVAVNNSNMLFDRKLDYLSNYISEIYCPHYMYSDLEKIHDNVFCPGGHFTEKVHDSFAQTLADYIREQQIL